MERKNKGGERKRGEQWRGRQKDRGCQGNKRRLRVTEKERMDKENEAQREIKGGDFHCNKRKMEI